jgi:hypothetical protein
VSVLMAGSARGQMIGRFAAPRWRTTLAAALFVVVACVGGASRSDEIQQLLVRLSAVIVIAICLVPLDFSPIRGKPRVLLWVAAVWLLPLAQLIPLAPASWTALPGHGIYGEIAAATGTQGWRPLSLVPDLTIDAWLSLLPPAAAALVSAYLDRRERGWLMAVVVLTACASAVFGLTQLAAGPGALRLFRVTSENAPVGVFANRNHQAVFLACALPLVAVFAAGRVRHGARLEAALAVLAGCLVLLLAMIAATGSRMGVLLAAVGLAGAAWCWRGQGLSIVPRKARSRMQLAGIVLALGAVVAVSAWRGGALDRLAQTDFAEESRSASFAPMLQTASAFAPLGAGFGSFDSVYRRFEPDQLLSTIYLNEAHNEPMQLAIEGGLPALVLLALFMAWWMMAGARAFRSARSGSARAQTRAALVVTLILMLSSLVDYPLRTPLLGAVFALCCVELLEIGWPPRREVAPGA